MGDYTRLESFAAGADVSGMEQGSPAASAPAKARVRDVASLRFVARQPIIDREEKVFGYELLFRDGMENAFRSDDADAASRSTLNSSMLLGLDILCDGRRAFVNCTRDVLIRDLVTLLPSNQTVVEVLETVTPDDQVVAALQRLKEAGYQIALDDFVIKDPRERLTEFADLIKVDLRRTPAAECADMVKRYGPWRCRLLAEKVETRQEFLTSRNQGFLYFQGYFFRKPEIVATREIPANHLNYLRMLQAVSRPELDVRELERMIKTEASICYRLLRYLNSPVFALTNEIHSVRHALSMLGEREVRRWVRLVAAVGAGQSKTSDLVLSALVRARFGELLGLRVPHGETDLFLLGLISLLDAMLEIPMADVLDRIPLDRETKSVLLGNPSPLRPLYQLMLAYESGEWQEASELAARLHLEENDVAGLHWQALQWAREVSSAA